MCKAKCALACRPVRCLAVDAGNEWFVTGSADRTIKIWDLATGQLRLTLTGHIEQARASASVQDLFDGVMEACLASRQMV